MSRLEGLNGLGLTVYGSGFRVQGSGQPPVETGGVEGLAIFLIAALHGKHVQLLLPLHHSLHRQHRLLCACCLGGRCLRAVRARARACIHVCERARVRACVRACVRARVSMRVCNQACIRMCVVRVRASAFARPNARAHVCLKERERERRERECVCVCVRA